MFKAVCKKQIPKMKSYVTNSYIKRLSFYCLIHFYKRHRLGVVNLSTGLLTTKLKYIFLFPGILETIRTIPDNGVILAVTDAGTHMKELEEEIRKLSEEKNVKIPWSSLHSAGQSARTRCQFTDACQTVGCSIEPTLIRRPSSNLLFTWFANIAILILPPPTHTVL